MSTPEEQKEAQAARILTSNAIFELRHLAARVFEQYALHQQNRVWDLLEETSEQLMTITQLFEQEQRAFARLHDDKDKKETAACPK